MAHWRCSVENNTTEYQKSFGYFSIWAINFFVKVAFRFYFAILKGICIFLFIALTKVSKIRLRLVYNLSLNVPAELRSSSRSNLNVKHQIQVSFEVDLAVWPSDLALNLTAISRVHLRLKLYTTTNDKKEVEHEIKVKSEMLFLIENFLCEIIKIVFHSPDFCIGKNFLCFFTDRIFVIGHSNRILALVNCWTTLNMNFEHSCITDVQLKIGS